MNTRIGYCCINLSLNIGKRKKDQISVNRGMTKKTFESKGLQYVSELTLKNINDLEKILRWNLSNNIYVYRMSSEMFPCIGLYNLSDLPNFKLISDKLLEIGNYVTTSGMRVSFHPTHFCVLSSENPNVIKNTIDELNKHAEIMDIMGLDQSTYYPINIHVGSTKSSREEAAERFCTNFDLLSDSCKNRLVVENDDGKNQFSTKMLYDLVFLKIGIPITHDFHHHKYGPSDLSQKEALELAISTWKTKALTHMSSPKTIEDPKCLVTAHADYIYERIETFGLDFDCEIEAKAKDLAVIKYRKDFE
jgi:UV DNA damage endonuclease